MALELIETKKNRPGKFSFPTLSIYSKLHKLVFNIEGTALLYTLGDGEIVDYVQMYRDTKNPDVFYIKPAQQNDPGARKLGRARSTKAGGRFVGGGVIIKSLGWDIDKGVTIRILEDKRHPGMIVVDRNEIV